VAQTLNADERKTGPAALENLKQEARAPGGENLRAHLLLIALLQIAESGETDLKVFVPDLQKLELLVAKGQLTPEIKAALDPSHFVGDTPTIALKPK
jgi:hypothetical protein